MYRKIAILMFAALLLAAPQSGEAAYTLKNGKLVDKRTVATMSLQEHFNAGVTAIDKNEWREALFQFRIVSSNWPNTEIGRDARYYLGLSFIHIKDYDLANKALTAYIEENPNGKFFEEAVRQKLAVAEAFQDGAMRHLFGLEQLPKWLPSRSKALDIYDEVVTSLPGHGLAAEALFQKARLLHRNRNFTESTEYYQKLIQRFPKDERVAESYLSISQVYYDQCRAEENNPDLLPLAKRNTQRFKNAFPGRAESDELDHLILEMREVYAEGMYETGRFFERVKKPRSSVIYYLNAMKRFPDTKIVEKCRDRLNELESEADSLNISKDMWS